MDAAWTRAPGSARAHDARGRFGPNTNVMASAIEALRTEKASMGRERERASGGRGLVGSREEGARM